MQVQRRARGLVKKALRIKRLEDRLRYLKEFRFPALEHQGVYSQRLSNIVPVNQPLVLISQIQRSGGTLLSRLFDGHPELHAHPYELLIGNPDKAIWPDLDLSATPHDWFEALYERRIRRLILDGYTKDVVANPTRGIDLHPFLFMPRLQWHIFEAEIGRGSPSSQRQILDAYMTSYFNAWVDNQNLYATPKKYVTGFTPRVAMHRDGVERLFRDYPEGRLISIIREPASWYASASLHNDRVYREMGPGPSIELWRQSTMGAIEAKRAHPDSVLLVRFEALVNDPEDQIKAITENLGITMHDSLLQPTFQGLPTRANSSFEVAPAQIVAGAAGRSDRLDADTVALITELTASVLDEVNSVMPQ